MSNIISYYLFALTFIFGFSLLICEIVKSKLMRFLIAVPISISVAILAYKIFLN